MGTWTRYLYSSVISYLDCLVALQNVLQLGYRGGTSSLGKPDPAPDLWRRNPDCGHAVGGEGGDVGHGGQGTGREQKEMKGWQVWSRGEGDVSEALNTVRKLRVISVLLRLHGDI